jgi:hypothetical protein
MIIYWAETYWLKNKNETLLVISGKTGHEFNAEKPEHLFMSCEDNVEECRNMQESNTFVVWE